ncbi:MAG TPA: LysR family transcriptional regulator [Blastocatellia bacterium]|nr:LysR family transcriptional regulator [Blastocatellia bacterium]HMV82049.1 LysR family transcriptional regulator [Blastocatellia bacterium]HMX24051.1 LysR family transcriptional regulator [Blastocatellia bacterium]HMZ16922.1 LysR family transcriptional regulator [Blastocatellia bacterium]HNG29377.1 LysR family transcriptional regulator [Blastocatellia bacterium]
MLETRHLKLIVAVSEEKSVTRAGERLHLTQSALSHQLRDIEERLGTLLFSRVNKRMILTQAGERLLHSARQVLDELKRTEDDIAQIAAGDHGSLRISTECYTCYHWLPGVLKDFHRKFPKVEVKILLEATHHPIPALLNGKLDCAIVSDAVRDKRLTYRPLFRDEVVVIMSPHHPLAGRTFISPKDFADQTVFSYSPPSESTLYNKVLLPAGVKPARFSEVQLTEAIIEMVKAGLGVSALARWAVARQIESGKLAARPLTRKGFQRQWSAALLKNDFTPAYVIEFIELLSKRSLPVVSPRK